MIKIKEKGKVSEELHTSNNVFPDFINHIQNTKISKKHLQTNFYG